MKAKYAVIFASTKCNVTDEYLEIDEELMALAQMQNGFVSYESLNNDFRSIFISYWESKEAIEEWKINAKHVFAKANVSKWYSRYLSQICLIESSHEWMLSAPKP